MVQIGNFFFKYRNWLFIIFYALLFVPNVPQLFTEKNFGPNYYLYPLIIGLVITIAGQAIRGATIGLAYIIRGGKNKKVYAEDLVTTGIFSHCRNPLYVGNILMLAGVGVLSNSLLYVVIMIPFFLFVYQAIVLAEENFLRNKFGEQFNNYCVNVNRWVPRLSGLTKTFSGMRFNWKRYINKEHTTTFIWLCGIVLLLLFYYPQLTHYNAHYRNGLLIIVLSFLLLIYVLIRVAKKSGKLNDQ
ncbi:MAG TPA: isoprenylcysteine carboxylmethyltransferase family protein [Parafilimonas sp.]|nr:isoprenylcysteine carboxylmethyltransferase family protein [Parafilimonas sp.]